MDVQKFKKLPVMGILRGIEADSIAPLVDTATSSGLETLEITMNTKGAAELIARAVKLSGSRLCIGAGTVLNLESLKSALSAGAAFIVMPCLIEAVAEYCLKNKIPFFPGALTPNEIYGAWQRGATMVKVFPAGSLGPQYFKEIKAPFSDVELLACSGVTADNLGSYFSNGASAVSFGASIFKKEWLAKKDFESIGKSIKAFLSALKDSDYEKRVS